MSITESGLDRIAAANRWQAARESAAAYSAGNAQFRRDQRVEEGVASDTARPRPQDRAEASAPSASPSATAQLLDIVV
jgi:hypothetical protein